MSGTKCKPSVKLFSNETIESAIASFSDLKKRDLLGGDGADALLLAAVKRLGRSIGRRARI